jgi:hypothetical protein
VEVGACEVNHWPKVKPSVCNVGGIESEELVGSFDAPEIFECAVPVKQKLTFVFLHLRLKFIFQNLADHQVGSVELHSFLGVRLSIREPNNIQVQNPEGILFKSEPVIEIKNFEPAHVIGHEQSQNKSAICPDNFGVEDTLFKRGHIETC